MSAHDSWRRPVGALVLAAVLMACDGCRPGTADGAAAPLRIGVLPDLDTLPMLVAEREGFFAEAGLQVEILHAASAAERDQLLQAGRIDGMVTDPVALVLYHAGGLPVTAVRQSRVPLPGQPQFRLLLAPGATAQRLEDLRGQAVATSRGTIAEYVLHRLLASAGMTPDEVTITAVPALPARYALLTEGRIAAAVIPEPLATQAVLAGARPLADEVDQRPFCCSVIGFRDAVVSARPSAVAAFVAALDRAAAAIHADPPRALRLAVEARLLSPECAAVMTRLDYPSGGLPDRALVEAIGQWLKAEGRVREIAPFEAMARAVGPAGASATP